MGCLLEQYLCAIQGDDEDYQATFTVDGTSPLDLTGWTLNFVLLENQDDLPASALVEKNVSSFAAPATGVANFSLTNVDTSQTIGKYFFRLKLISPASKVKTVLRGTFEIGWAK